MDAQHGFSPPTAISAAILAKVFLFAAITVLIAEAIGARTIPLGGPYSVVLLPLLWASLIAQLLMHTPR